MKLRRKSNVSRTLETATGMDRTRKEYLSLLVPALLPALVFVVCMITSSCRQPRAHAMPTAAGTNWQQQRLARYEKQVYDSALANIRTGDLVTRLGTDITSEMFRQMNRQDASFSHCGIASLENDTVFVYHAMGGEFNPDQTLLRQPLWVYAHASENKALGIFRPALQKDGRQQMMNWVRQQYSSKLMFDMKFDFADDSRQYCAEMVAKALLQGAKHNEWLQFSHAGKLQYVAIDNLYRNALVEEVARFSY